jgi:hypothetical protein
MDSFNALRALSIEDVGDGAAIRESQRSDFQRRRWKPSSTLGDRLQNQVAYLKKGEELDQRPFVEIFQLGQRDRNSCNDPLHGVSQLIGE